MSLLVSDTDPSWWRGCVIYQIYPRSFRDSNGDGVGDLAGITAKLDYVASLGVDGIWISPFFRSPMKDFGYDVSDYRDVEPVFGTLADFDRLVEEAHARGLKVLIDQVLSHTSDQHPWFLNSRSSRGAERADWYVWADPKPDGSPPNNWMSVFGGSAWQWESRRQQYYLHNFLVSQPDLNFYNPAVVDQLLDDVAFWLDRGVDGFRLDTANFYYHDEQLRDNPARPMDAAVPSAIPGVYPYAYQLHVHDRNRPETLGFLQRLRALLDRYPGATTIGEIGGDDSLPLMAEYTAGGDKLHMAYTFSLLTARFSGRFVHDLIAELEGQLDNGWPCWSLGNHDVTRVMTRWGEALGSEDSDDLARVTMAMLLSLRGSVCIYQGEELGLPDVVVPYEQVQDPFGLALWPEYKGRDGCRTAMPWTRGGLHAGFSDVEPWLAVPVPEAHRARAVDVQEHRPASILNAYRRFLRWRHGHAALRLGSIELLGELPDDALVFIRAHEGERILVAFNLSNAPLSVPVPGGAGTPLEGHGFPAVQPEKGQLALPPFGAYFGRL